MSHTGTLMKGKIDAAECQMDHIQVLSAEEAEQVCNTIMDLRSRWIQRQERPFYTLGIASYMDATQGRFYEYQQKAKDFNPVLLESFGWLYERVSNACAEMIGEPCVYSPGLAYPGFHIFISDGKKEIATSASMHYDLQYDNIDWSPYPNVDFTRQLSFTLALRLPQQGTGLYLWNVNDQRLRRLSPEDRKKYIAANNDPKYHSYSLGNMVIHNGHYLHQIARIRQMAEGDQRITLQGHAISSNNTWVLYW